MKKNSQSKSGSVLRKSDSGISPSEGLFSEETRETGSETLNSDGIKRRKFLGMGLLGLAGLSLPLGTKAEGKTAIEDFVKKSISLAESVSSQSDSF
ncbi:MAG: hypothetical protein ACOYKR_12025, partial [Sphingobacterium thalpophilum]